MDCSFVPGLVTRAVYRAAPARETHALSPQPRASAALSSSLTPHPRGRSPR